MIARADEADELVATLRAAGCVFAEDEATVLLAAAATRQHLAAMVAQRLAGLPLEPIVGWAAFAGLQVGVDQGVFVPRRRTEFLARCAVDRLASADAAQHVVVDLCCGSGAVGLAVAAGLAPARIALHATDIDGTAVRCARRNLEPIGGSVHLGDLYDPLPEALNGHVDLLLANAPYVPTAAIALMPREARLHEPAVTLDGGDDGVDVHRRVAAGARRWLAPGAAIMIETGSRQAVVTAQCLADNGFRTEARCSAEFDCTVVIGYN